MQRRAINGYNYDRYLRGATSPRTPLALLCTFLFCHLATSQLELGTLYILWLDLCAYKEKHSFGCTCAHSRKSDLAELIYKTVIWLNLLFTLEMYSNLPTTIIMHVYMHATCTKLTADGESYTQLLYYIIMQLLLYPTLQTQY